MKISWPKGAIALARPGALENHEAALSLILVLHLKILLTFPHKKQTQKMDKLFLSALDLAYISARIAKKISYVRCQQTKLSW